MHMMHAWVVLQVHALAGHSADVLNTLAARADVRMQLAGMLEVGSRGRCMGGHAGAILHGMHLTLLNAGDLAEFYTCVSVDRLADVDSSMMRPWCAHDASMTSYIYSQLWAPDCLTHITCFQSALEKNAL